MKLIQTTNIDSQIVLPDGLINIGKIDRRVCAKNNCGVPTFYNDENSIILNWVGYYKIDVTIVAEAGKDGNIIIDLLGNNAILKGAQIMETVASPDVKTIHVSKIVRVERGCCRFPTEAIKVQLRNSSEFEIKVITVNLSAIKVE